MTVQLKVLEKSVFIMPRKPMNMQRAIDRWFVRKGVTKPKYRLIRDSSDLNRRLELGGVNARIFASESRHSGESFSIVIESMSGAPYIFRVSADCKEIRLESAYGEKSHGEVKKIVSQIEKAVRKS